jgi:hypothetical protein
MVLLKRCLGLAAIAAMALGLSACERKITRVEVTQQAQTCFQCHSDTNTVIVAATQQWEHSLHASGGTLNENDSSCKGCHTSEGFIARISGVTPPDVIEDPTAIHCFTCHAPHTNGDFGLRVKAPVTLVNNVTYDLGEGNLCATCHQARRNVNTYVTATTTLSSRWGPHHSPQGDMLIGTNGYEYAGVTYEITNHRSAVQDGCIACHMKTTSRYVVGGHSVNMAYDLGGEEVLNTDACTTCHGAITDFGDVGHVEATVDSLIADLSARLDAAGLTTAGVPKAVTTSRDSAGAVWNMLLASEDRSHGMHNAKYIIGLLTSAINYISGPAPSTPVAARR